MDGLQSGDAKVWAHVEVIPLEILDFPNLEMLLSLPIPYLINLYAYITT